MYRLLALINGEIACMELFMFYRQPFSLHKVVNFFILIFFVVANAIQYSNMSVVSTISIILKSEDYVSFQLWVLVILIIFNITYFLFRNKMVLCKSMRFNSGCDCNLTKFINCRLILCISFIAMILVICNYWNDPLQLIIRFDDYVFVDEKPEENTMSNLVFSKIVRSIPFICYILSCNYAFGKRQKILLFLFMLVALFPTSLSRNAMAMYWMPVLFYKWPLIMKRNIFIIVLLFGILFLFPFMNNFRDYNIGNGIDWGFDFSYMNTLHFDSSQEFMIAMRDNIVTNGYQLIGVLLFFVPRSIWVSKPVGSGEFLASKHADAFPNISMPFWGEGYINFGIAGIILFTLILSAFCNYFDFKYWTNNSSSKNENLAPIYFILLGAMIFVMRGDLMSSYAYTLSIIVDYLLIYKIAKKSISVCKK